jgi:YbbR domain-containing protein
VRLLHNLSYKIVAVIVAGLFWAAAQGIESVEKNLDVPIALRDVPDDVVVVGQSSSEVNVRIVGSRAAVRRAERVVTRYPISLTGVRPGEARVGVELDRLSDILPRGARPTARSPSSVTVRLDTRIRKRVRVKPNLVGEVPEGYRLIGVEVEPEEVVLEGSKQVLRSIREVPTDPIELGSLSGTTEAEVDLTLRSPHVWRADEGEAIQVRVRLEREAPLEQTPGADGAESDGGEDPA